jgi:hypothetical protein
MFKFGVNGMRAAVTRLVYDCSRHISMKQLACPIYPFPLDHFRLPNVLLFAGLDPSQLRQCGRNADSHGLSNSYHD